MGNKTDGSDVIGMYPLFPDDTCRFLVFDFDDHADEQGERWKTDVAALRTICKQNEVPVLVERSRSGNGAHVWLFFEEAIPASLARKFGSALLTKGASSVNLRDFKTYDRMLPAQEHLPPGGLGNLIALPLQGQALRQGNSAFVDERWNAYPDQWEFLKSARKIPKSFVEQKSEEWSSNGELGILAETAALEPSEKPWQKRTAGFFPEDALSGIKITYADGLYIDTTDVKPRLQNQMRRLAAFSNPEFYKTKALGFSTHGIPRIVYCGEDVEHCIHLPRGCLDVLLSKLTDAGISFTIEDARQTGRPVSMEFRGSLYPQQASAANAMLQYDTGILSAATAFGKTAVGAYLIAQRKVNALVLVHTSEIMQNWVEDLTKFLQINETPPDYVTPKGRHKKRTSVIGTLYGGHNSLTGILDVAMVSSLGKHGIISTLVKDYGLVLMDECHHAGAANAEQVLSAVSAAYVYGLTATPKRDDGQERRIFFQFGPVRFRYTAKDRAAEQGIAHYVYPRFTRLLSPGKKLDFTQARRAITESATRNEQILQDVQDCVKKGRTPLVLTKERAHAAYLYQQLLPKADHVFLLQGGSKAKDREKLRSQLRTALPGESVVLVATGQYIGEGFNYPRLNTLMLAMPISWSGNVEQYAGRLHRDYADKKDVIIYDYVDAHIPVLESMYYKRLKTYKQIGYQIIADPVAQKQQINAIFDSDSYVVPFETDLRQAEKSIVIFSPVVSHARVKRFLEMITSRQGSGVLVSVFTLSCESLSPSHAQTAARLQTTLKQAGVLVEPRHGLHGHFAVIDERVVWYGNANLLSRSKEDDSLMRIENRDIALELLETFCKEPPVSAEFSTE